MEAIEETTESKTICLHHNDTDGRASAAIIRKALGPQVLLYEMDYGDIPPLDHILTTDNIIIVDFSLPKNEMVNLATYHNLTWIDHHKTSIDELIGISDDWPGIRDQNEAACVLTWQFYFPNQPVPTAVKLIGDRDIWKWAEIETGSFNEGLYQLDTRPFKDELWTPLLENDSTLLAQIIENGRILRSARLKSIHKALNGSGFPVILEGYHTFVVNIRGSGDIGQKIREMGYEIGYCYSDSFQNGEIKTFVSLYSDRVDVSIIAQKYGGGGHQGAAGFHFNRGISPFPPGMKISYDKQSK